MTGTAACPVCGSSNVKQIRAADITRLDEVSFS